MKRREAIKMAGFGALSLLRSRDTESPRPAFERSVELPAKLEGGFIELWDSMKNFGGHWGNGWTSYPIDWNAVLDSMREIGMTTIILKRLAVKVDSNIDKLYEPGGNGGPAGEILRLAQDKGMKVYLGLVDEPEFSFEQVTERYLFGRNAAEAADRRSVFGRNREVAREAWPLFREFRSFAGWYIPNELWNLNLSGGKSGLLHRFLLRTTKYLREDLARAESAMWRARAAEKQMAVSPYFNREYRGNGELASPAEVRREYSTILNGAGIDIVMVQDSYAVSGYDDAFVDAFGDAARAAKAQFWVNVENFAGGCPAPFARLTRQLELAKAHRPDKLVTFDFFHFMNPVVQDCCAQRDAPPMLCSEVTAIPCRDRFGSPVAEAGLLQRKVLYEQYRAAL
jgi:hypothetical protein